ncbi:MAG: cytochrome c biogenesis protein CcdA [Chloroflexota bacterium]
MRAAVAPGAARPRLLLLLIAALVILAAGVVFTFAPSAGDHGLITDLTVPAIVGAGLIDGFNPCAFGVLILFATFALGLASRQSLATSGGPPNTRAASRKVLGLGAFFILGVLATYVLIGLGLLTVLVTLTDFGGNHLPTRVAALIAIGLGLWMLRDVLLPGARWKLEAPEALHGRMRSWARASSPLLLLGGGVLIGLCTVPCSGAIYLGVVALLSTTGTLAAGLGGLLLYNLAYITPLVLLLVIASRPGMIRFVNRWHLEHATGTKVALAVVVLAMGFAILVMV